MKIGNLLTIIAANIRMNGRNTILPSLVLLFAIPLLYGTANLDCIQSADCLERMVSLIGIPMFTALASREHSRGLYEIVALRRVSLRFVVFLRVGISILGTLTLIFGFAVYMRICGCSFPLFCYAFRTLAAAMTLGLTGLFVASTTENTASGFLGAFCLSLLLQTGMLPGAFRPVANGVSFLLMSLLGGLGLAGVFFSEPSPC